MRGHSKATDISLSIRKSTFRKQLDWYTNNDCLMSEMGKNT